MSKQASPTVIGGFVIGAVVLAVLGIMFLGGGEFLKEKNKFVLYFDESVKGLETGAAVTFRGITVGKVTAVNAIVDPRTLTFGMEVLAEIEPSRFTLITAEDAEAALGDLAKAGLGTWQPVPPTAKGGRPHRVFVLSRASTVYTRSENTRGNRGSVDVDSVDSSGTQDDGPGAEAVNQLLAEALEGDGDGRWNAPPPGPKDERTLRSTSTRPARTRDSEGSVDDQWGEI